ncbi:MAG TPA: LuxR C-terminal-related transcriptional regulator [Reyranella sp.]|nr:LuxR C-terminal-related transcriptional regulator [Reyranella sp.]
MHVEPYESPAELLARPRSTAILAYDHPGWIAELVEALLERGARCAVIGFAEDAPATRIAEAILAGALDYLDWPFAPEDLVASLNRISARSARVLDRRERSARADAKLRRLSQRERDVVERMTEGLTNKDIGRILSISPRTVEIHRANAMGKLGVSSSAAAIRLALEASERGH